MADEKLRQELFYMVQLTSKYDFNNIDVVEGILRLENERQILVSPFGNRFKNRIFDIATGKNSESDCVICGQHADNNVICAHCMNTVVDSDYAKNKITNKEINETNNPLKTVNVFSLLKRLFQIVLIFVLILWLVFQIWIISIWTKIPNYNPKEKARNSSFELTKVESKEDALNQIKLDFPESEDYTVTFARIDNEYVGRFLLNKGDCCEEIEEKLSDEERYDYFFTEEVYVFYISYLKDYTSKIGIAEINSDGAILVEGSFNDGRRTDSFYKFR